MNEYILYGSRTLPATDTQPQRFQSLWMTRVEDGEDDEGNTLYRDIGPTVVTFSDISENMTESYAISEDGETRTGQQILDAFGMGAA